MRCFHPFLALAFLLLLVGCGQPEAQGNRVLPLPRLPEGRVPIWLRI